MRRGEKGDGCVRLVFWQWYCWTNSIGLALAVFIKSGISLVRRLQLSLAGIRCILRGNDL